MSKFNIGDKVISKGYPNLGEEVGIVVGIDTRENAFGKYLVKFDLLDEYTGWACRVYINDPYYIIEPYEGYAVWLDELEKVENESEEVSMSEFNIGDKVFSNDSCYTGKDVGVIVGIDPKAKASGKYLVKFDSIKGLEYELFCNNPDLIIEPYEGYAMWLDDLIKVEDGYEEDIMSKINIGDKVIVKGFPYCGEKVGVVVGIDMKGDGIGGKYLVEFNSLSKSEGWAYRDFRDNPDIIIEPYKGYAQWVDEDDLEKVEEECEEDIRTKFDKIREQKKEFIKDMSEKVLEMTLEIKEMEHEIEKIKKEWHL